MGDLIHDEPNRATIAPHYLPNDHEESPRVASIINTLSLEPHIEGGYYRQTDAGTTTIPSPHPLSPLSQETVTLMGGPPKDFNPYLRQMSTTIFYFISPNRPQGHFHRNRSRIIHTLHRGRARYVLIHEDGRIETYIVGHDIAKGEKLQWVVESGVWKACYLLDDAEGESDGMLISETVAPGFEYADHEFLSEKTAQIILSEDKFKELKWLIRQPHPPQQLNGGGSKESNDDGGENIQTGLEKLGIEEVNGNPKDEEDNILQNEVNGGAPKTTNGTSTEDPQQKQPRSAIDLLTGGSAVTTLG